MNARQIIDRLASLDEAVEAPEMEPGVMPEEPMVDPGRQAPRRSPAPDPWGVPPDFEPGQMPRPKAEGNSEVEQIENWLRATQQPAQDWEWDGENLRLLLDDGATEVYTRAQLDEAGVFGEVSFAESMEDEHFGPPQNAGPGASPQELGPAGPQEFNAEEFLNMDEPSGEMPPPSEDATGTIDAILGRTGSAPSPEVVGAGAEPGGSQELVIKVEGEPAKELGQAVSDLVSAIIGAVDGDETGTKTDEPGEKDGKNKEKPKKDNEGEKSEKDKKEKPEKDKKDSDKKDDDEE